MVEVIGAGLGRTGTMSFKKALEILGYDPCYHMVEVMDNKDLSFWLKVANKKEYDFCEIFERDGKKYKASCDFPSAQFWKEQLARYPEAKVILTKRDPEKWYASISETILKMLPVGPQSSTVSKIYSTLSGMNKFSMDVIVRDFFHGDLSKENCIRRFNDHNAEVIAECPKDKLLVYEVSEGWEPLCKFLGKPIPKVPFPHVNDTKSFQRFIRHANIVVYSRTVGLLLLVLLVALTVSYKWKVAWLKKEL